MLTKLQKFKRNKQLKNEIIRIVNLLGFLYDNTSREIKDELEIEEELENALIYLNAARLKIEAKDSQLILDGIEELLHNIKKNS